MFSLPTGQSYGSSSSVGVLSFKMALVCGKLTETYQHSLHVFLCIKYVTGGWRPESIRFTGAGVRDNYELLCRSWESNAGSLGKQPVFSTAEPFL